MRRKHPLSRKAAQDVASRRKAAGLRQLDLALQLGVSSSTISHWERLYAPIAPEKHALITHILDKEEQKQRGAAPEDSAP